MIDALAESRQGVDPAASPTADAVPDRPERDQSLPADDAQPPASSPSVPAYPPTRRPTRSRNLPVVPERGPGTFRLAPDPVGQPGTVGTRGRGELVTYTVELEHTLPFDVKTIARSIDRTLADPRGWTANGAQAVRRVTGQPDLRIIVATPETTDALCAPLDTGGRLSCRNGDLVVLNAWRWANGADAYRDVKEYRRYLVNHEFGHALGNSHQDCAEQGTRASVMMQQTKGLQGCAPNPWPFP